MNIKGQKDIGYEPLFTTIEAKQQFLQDQLDLVREVKDGEKTWNDVNIMRQGYGYPDTNTDSLRRSFTQLVNYDLEGWVNAPADKSVVISEKESININFEKGETTSSRVVNLTDEELRSPSALLKAHGYDPKEWVIKQASNTQLNRLAPTGKTKSYTSRITVKPNDSHVHDIEQVSDFLKNFKPPMLNIPKNNSNSEEVLLIPFYDFHWGRLEEKGSEYEGFDVEEEKQKIIEHVQKYIAKFKDRTFKKIYLVVGQDFFNSSFTKFTSSQQHLQSNALEFKAMFKSGCELLIGIINMFAQISNNVEVIGSVGNHSWAEEISAFLLLEAYYRNVDNITINAEGAVRKYLEIGQSCVGLAHADKEGDRLYGLMQIEAKDIWSRTKTHVFITGHLHHFEVKSKQGVEVYRCPTICYRDKWTVDSGYTQNDPKTMCFIFDENEGLTETHFMYL